MTTTIFTVTGLCCPAEEKLIRNKLKSISGIEQLDFNLISQEVKVTHNIGDISVISKAISEIGMQADIKKEIEPKKPVAKLTDKKQWMLIVFGGLFALSAEVYSYIYQNEKSILVAVLAVLGVLTRNRINFRFFY